MKKILLQNNLMFIPIITTNDFIPNVETRYMAASILGALIEEIYTESEIKKAYPNAKEADGFLDVKRVYDL